MNWYLWYSPLKDPRSSYRKLAWVGHEPTTTESHSLICTKKYWNEDKDWVTNYHWNILIIAPVPTSSPERSFPLFLTLLPLACCRSTFVVPQFTFPDLLFRILTPLGCCSAFYHVEFIVPRFTISDLLLRVLPFQICCSVFRIPAFSVLPQTSNPCSSNIPKISGGIRVRIPQELDVVAFWSWNLDVVAFWSWNLHVVVF